MYVLRLFLFAAALTFVLFACGSGDSGTDAGTDSGIAADAGPDGG
jgi:hypothetical protein